VTRSKVRTQNIQILRTVVQISEPLWRSVRYLCTASCVRWRPMVHWGQQNVARLKSVQCTGG